MYANFNFFFFSAKEQQQRQQQEILKKQQIEQQRLLLHDEQHLQQQQQEAGVLPWLQQKTTPTSQQSLSFLQIQKEEETHAKEMVSTSTWRCHHYIILINFIL